MIKKKKISRAGLAKWVVISSHSELREAVCEDNDMFILGAWESYSCWTINKIKRKNAILEWKSGKIKWSEWQKWRKMKPEDKRGQEKKLESTSQYLNRWETFYKKYSDDPLFKSGFITKGKSKSFDTLDHCEVYHFLNKLIVTSDISEKEPEKTRLRKLDRSKIKPRAHLEKNDLRFQNLIGANLGGAILSGANLTETNLSGAILYRANLRKAYLRGANLIEASFDESEILEATDWDMAFYSKGVLERLKKLDKKIQEVPFPRNCESNLNFAYYFF